MELAAEEYGLGWVHQVSTGRLKEDQSKCHTNGGDELSIRKLPKRRRLKTNKWNLQTNAGFGRRIECCSEEEKQASCKTVQTI
jgi:hypothetical protein